MDENIALSLRIPGRPLSSSLSKDYSIESRSSSSLLFLPRCCPQLSGPNLVRSINHARITMFG